MWIASCFELKKIICFLRVGLCKKGCIGCLTGSCGILEWIEDCQIPFEHEVFQFINAHDPQTDTLPLESRGSRGFLEGTHTHQPGYTQIGCVCLGGVAYRPKAFADFAVI